MQSLLTTLTELEKVKDVVSNIESAFFDIPFENSDFQNLHFVLGSQVTVERAYRALGLKMYSKIQALRDSKYALLREDIDIEELREKVKNPNTSYFDVKRANLDINQKLENRAYTYKLINDALHELDILYEVFQAMPKISREDFENAEKDHFQIKLERQANGITGAIESKVNMQEDFQRMIKEAQRLTQEIKKID